MLEILFNRSLTQSISKPTRVAEQSQSVLHLVFVIDIIKKCCTECVVLMCRTVVLKTMISPNFLSQPCQSIVVKCYFFLPTTLAFLITSESGIINQNVCGMKVRCNTCPCFFEAPFSFVFEISSVIKLKKYVPNVHGSYEILLVYRGKKSSFAQTKKTVYLKFVHSLNAATGDQTKKVSFSYTS